MTRAETNDRNADRWSWARTIQVLRLRRALKIESALTDAHRDARCAPKRLDHEAGRLATTTPLEP